MGKTNKKQEEFPNLLKQYSGWIAALVVIVAFGYYLNKGVFPILAFEQLPRSLAYYVAEQSGLPNNDGEMNLGVHYTKPGDTVTMWVTVKNMSKNPAGFTWFPVSTILDEGPDYPFAHAIGVGTANPIDNRPYWVDSDSFAINNNRFTYYNGPEVQRNGYVTFAWDVKINQNAIPGMYTLDLDLVREWDEHGIRVNESGRMLANQFIRWNFKISELNVYDIPVNSAITDTHSVLYTSRVPGETSTDVMVVSRGASQEVVYTIYDPEKVSIADPLRGRFLIYSSNPYTWSAKIIEPDGSLYMDITDLTPGYPITNALISPNERYIALNTSNFPGEFYIYDTQTQELTAHVPIFNPWLSNGGNYRYYNYWWSPDSSKLYARWTDNRTSLLVNNNSGIDQLLMPPNNNIEPIPVITNLQIKDIGFDLLSGIAIGSSYKTDNNNPVSPSDMMLIYPNTGAVNSIAHSDVSTYEVKAISQDGTMFAYETINDVGNGQMQHLLWVSRVNDIYQPILIEEYPRYLGTSRYYGGKWKDMFSAGFSPNNKIFYYIGQADGVISNIDPPIDFYDEFFVSGLDLLDRTQYITGLTTYSSGGLLLPPVLKPLAVY